MLDLSTAVLCDFAQVRDRLLFVSSGAVSRLYRQELPSPLGLMVGLVIEVPLEDAGMDHRLRAEVINRHGTVLATLENLFRVSDAGLFPHEVQQVPLVLSITGVRARTWGTHQVRLYLDDELVRALTLYVVPAAGPQAAPRPTPTPSRTADDEGSLGGTDAGPVETGEQAGEAAEPAPDAPAEPVSEPVGAADPVFALTDEPGSADAPAEGRPDTGGAAEAGEPEPTPVSWGDPAGGEAAPDAGPGPDAAPPETPAFAGATIAAEPADAPAATSEETAVTPAPGAPAEGGDEGPEEERPAEGGSRFAFRYRYEDDEG
jgi:hypothetical protein